MNTPQEATKSMAPSILTRMEQINKAIDEALDCLKNLEGKLGPIMISPPANMAGLLQEQGEPVVSDVQTKLVQVINRITSLSEDIRRIRNSVDL